MKHYVEIISSDLSGEEGAQTRFIPAMEIDLTDKEWAYAMTVLGPVLEKGRKPGAVAAAEQTRLLGLEQRREIRQWLRDNGYDIHVRGSISPSMMEAFRTKTPNPRRAAPVAETVADEGPKVTADAPEVAPAEPERESQGLARRWLREHGFNPPARGSLSPDLMEAYRNRPQEPHGAGEAAVDNVVEMKPRTAPKTTAKAPVKATATTAKTTQKTATAPRTRAAAATKTATKTVQAKVK